MSIGFNTISTLPVPATFRRDELDERRQQREPATVAQPQPQQAGEVTRIRTRASVAAQRIDEQAPRYANNLSPYARNAVAAYGSNAPSIEERLGVELVGVDLYV